MLSSLPLPVGPLSLNDVDTRTDIAVADLPPFDNMDAFTQFILDNETWYNNEPFWSRMHEMDLDAEMERVGFDRSKIIHGGVFGVVDRELFPDAAEDNTEDYGRKAAWHVIGARLP